MSDTIHDRINQEVEAARNACDSSGTNSEECAAAWDAVEELQAEAAHQRDKGEGKAKSSLEQYCDSNPDADECRVYDN